MMSKEIEQSISDFLESCTVRYTCALVGETKRDEWACDEWRVYFNLPGKDAQAFEFFTGLGLRSKIEDHPLGRIEAHSLRNTNRNSLAWESARKAYCKPVAPSAAAVLYSLVRDAEGAEQSFADWCADYGYDDDSRKAFSIYEQCQKEGKKLRGVFSREQIKTISDLLQDY